MRQSINDSRIALFAAVALAAGSAAVSASPLDELLPRPKEVCALSGTVPTCAGLPPGGYALSVRGSYKLGNVDAIPIAEVRVAGGGTVVQGSETVHVGGMSARIGICSASTARTGSPRSPSIRAA